MSGEAVLNILNSTRFTEKFRDFNWAELSDKQLSIFISLASINNCFLAVYFVRIIEADGNIPDIL